MVLLKLEWVFLFLDIRILRWWKHLLFKVKWLKYCVTFGKFSGYLFKLFQRENITTNIFTRFSIIFYLQLPSLVLLVLDHVEKEIYIYIHIYVNRIKTSHFTLKKKMRQQLNVTRAIPQWQDYYRCQGFRTVKFTTEMGIMFYKFLKLLWRKMFTFINDIWSFQTVSFNGWVLLIEIYLNFGYQNSAGECGLWKIIKNLTCYLYMNINITINRKLKRDINGNLISHAIEIVGRRLAKTANRWKRIEWVRNYILIKT